MTALLLASGGVVCVTESARGCPDWPRCYGQMLPPMRIDAIIEYTHRLTAALTSPFILAAAVIGWIKVRSVRWVSWPPLAAIVLAAAVAGFGALAVIRGLPPWAAAIDLGSALLVLALLVTASVVAWAGREDTAERLAFEGRFARLSLCAAASLFVVLVSGVLVAEQGSVVRCLGCVVEPRPPALPASHGGSQLARELAAVVASLFIGAVVVGAWRRRQNDPVLRYTASAAGLLLVSEAIVGALLVATGGTTLLLVISVATAVALWASLVATVVLSGLPPGGVRRERYAPSASASAT